MARRIIIMAVEVESDVQIDDDGSSIVTLTDEQLVGGLQARLEEFYVSTPDPTGRYEVFTHEVVPEDTLAAAVDPDAAKALWAAASVGLDGADDALDPLDACHAWTALQTLQGAS